MRPDRSETDRIADQLRRASAGGAWHGDSLAELLARIDARAAAARPLPDAHTIQEIVRHVEATRRMILRRLRGDPRPLTPEEDWPPASARPDERAWDADRRALERSTAELLEAIGRLEDSALDGPVLPGFASFYATLHGLVQHDLYHAGQIAVLAKGARGSGEGASGGGRGAASSRGAAGRTPRSSS